MFETASFIIYNRHTLKTKKRGVVFVVWGQIFPGSISRVVFVPHPGGNMPNGEISRAGLGAPVSWGRHGQKFEDDVARSADLSCA